MPIYMYRARDATGKLVKGTMEVINREELIDKLHKRGCIPTKLTEAIPGIKIETAFYKVTRISIEDMIMFNIQFANMISAGVSILPSLRTLSGQMENEKLRQVISDIANKVEGGDSFSGALARHPRIFPRLFVNIVKAGEASGKLELVLRRYAEFIEYQADVRQKIKGTLLYPILLLCVGVLVTLFIVTFIVPQFAQIFQKMGIKLPLFTLILYKVGTMIKRFWFTFILLTLVAILGIRFYADTAKGRLKIDTLKLKLPIIGPLYRKAAISRFTRTLATLVASGVPILYSLDMVKEVAGNEVLSRVLTDVRNSVERGESLSGPLRMSGEFPADVVQMISVGEDTGNLEGMLSKISDFYDMSLSYAIRKLTTILEPLLLVIMGGMVGFIMASMLMPIFDMIKMLRR